LASKPVALVDATDLLPQDQRDFLVQAALDGLYRMVWSETILQETACAIHRRLRERDGLSQRAKTEHMLGLLTSALTAVDAGAGADEDAIRSRIEAMGEDPESWGTTDRNDRHVIAAAVVGSADTLVTSDSRFDAEFCRKTFDVRVMNADDFLVEIFSQTADRHLHISLDALAGRWKRPAPFSRAQVIGRLEAPLPKAMAYLVKARGFSRDHPPST
jgi:predicted nucleic acid-binding protein